MHPISRGATRRSVAALAVVLLAACSGPAAEPGDTPAPTPSVSTSPEPDGPVVVAISVDGLNPDAITTLGPARAPHLWRLIDEGASTLNARTARERTTTLPNHVGMMTGRPVAGANGTSITFNDDNGSTLATVLGAYVPSLFDVAHDAGVRTALFAEKDKFRFLVRSWDGNHGAEDETGMDDGRDKIDLAAIAKADRLVEQVVAAVTEQGAGLTFWHIAAPDVAGHASGWMSSRYLSAVGDADDQIGRLLVALDADADLADRTTILLTADHGGAKGARSHRAGTVLADHRVPFLAWGRDVTPAADLYALNPDLADPAQKLPGYSGEQPVRNLDLADTALALLGLPDLSDSSVALTTR